LFTALIVALFTALIVALFTALIVAVIVAIALLGAITLLFSAATGHHHSVIMLSMLKIILSSHPVTECQRIAPKCLVFLDYLVGGATDFSLRAATFKVGVATTTTWAAPISTMTARSFRRLALLHILISSIGPEQ